MSGAHRSLQGRWWGRGPAEPWMCLFVLADLVMFGSFFQLLAKLRVEQPQVQAAGTLALNQLSGTLNTLVLLTSSLLLVLACHRLLRGEGAAGRRLLDGTMVLGWLFVVIKSLEYYSKYSQGVDPLSDDFFFYYFVLTGIHLAHVLFGLAMLVILRKLSTHREFPNFASQAVSAIALFWHLVDLLWIFLFTLFYLLP